MQFPTGIEQFDRSAYLTINRDWSNPIFDIIMPFMREKENWIPLYILIAVWLVYKFRWNGLYIILILAVTITISDQVSSFIFKPLFARTRPCNVPELASQANLLIGCSQSFSFTSSHATNHFALAIVFGLLFFRTRKWFLYVGMVWAAIIAYAQVYVGVHYPMDVICGAALGTLIGIAVYLSAKYLLLRKSGWYSIVQ